MLKKPILAILLAAIVLLTCGCKSGNAEKAVYHMSADYPSYGTVEELYDEATHVIYGRVTEINNEMLSYSIPPKETDKEPTTVYTVEILHCYKGEVSGNTFYIRQFGGETDTKIYIYPDEPRLQTDEAYILFARRSPGKEHTAWLLNAAQSAYQVTDGQELIDVGGSGFRFDFATLAALEGAALG